MEATDANRGPVNSPQLFELHLLGGAIERRYRRLRPEIDRLPWGTLDSSRYPISLVEAARRSWTLAAFQEHRTAAACAATLQSMICARCPVDLIATAARFPLDEVAHVEICARLAAELGGGTPVFHHPDSLIPEPRSRLSPILQTADRVVRYFCVGEAISIRLLRGTWRAARHPLVKAVLGRIVKDEAAHGQFGWIFLDWAGEQLGQEELRHLRQVASDTITQLVESWSNLSTESVLHDADINALGWMESRAYLQLAQRSLRECVIEPLRRRRIHVN
jgi:hypothetical protein